MNIGSNNRFTATPLDLSKYVSEYETNRTQIMKEIIPGTQTGVALDIGCGPGYYTKILKEKGWRATIIDTDSSNIAIARQYAEKEYIGDAISILQKLPSNKFELVLCLEIIEHMSKQDGQVMLENVRRTLKRGGHLLLSTPNKISPEGLGGYFWGEKIRGWPKWDAWDPTHVHIYSSFEIINFLKNKGFSIKRITGYYYEGRLPIIGRWSLPVLFSKHWPLNRLGFKIILDCC